MSLEIEVPSQYRAICEDWYDASDSMMYAIASTGKLALGNRKPAEAETEKDWLGILLRNLQSEIRYCLRIARKKPENKRDAFDDEEIRKLLDFESWAEAEEVELQMKD